MKLKHTCICFSILLCIAFGILYLLGHGKETAKLCIDVCYRISVSAIFRDIFWSEILGCPLSWMLVAMHDTPQVGSRNFIFL